MAKRKLFPLINKQQKKVKKSTSVLMARVGETAVNEFTLNFKRGGFQDRSVKKWKKRKNNVDPGRGVLIGKANRRGRGLRLSRSIARVKTSHKKVTIGIKGGASVYAAVHNYGKKAGRGDGFKMTKRQFIGDSRTLNKKIKRLIKKTLNKIL